MTNAEKFSHIVRLAKSVDQKGLAELTREEQHAVMFLGNKYPVVVEEGTLKYNKNGTRFAWVCSYVDSRSLNKFLGTKETFSTKSFAVYDGEVEPFKKASRLDCLKEYPGTFLLPEERDYTIDLFPQPKETIKYEYVRQTIAGAIARVSSALTFNEKMPKEYLAIHLVSYRNKAEFEELAEKVGVNGTNLLNFNPELRRAPAGDLEYENSNSPSSYLATYIYLATKNCLLKPKTEEEI